MKEPRDYFGYSVAISMALRSLPENKRLALLEIVEMFGFEHQECAVEDEEIMAVWRRLRPTMEKGWRAVEDGTKGGKVTQAKKGKKQPTPDDEQKPSALPLPNDGAPSAEFEKYIADIIKIFPFLAGIAKEPKPLNEAQKEYLIKRWGYYLVCPALAKVAAENNRERGVCERVVEELESAEHCFNEWRDDNLPQIAKAQSGKELTFTKYSYLRYRYGRANVILKAKQADTMKLKKSNEPWLKPYTEVGSTIETMIVNNINPKEGTLAYAYKIEPFDDSPSNAKLEALGIYAGFDKGFDITTTPPHLYLRIADSNGRYNLLPHVEQPYPTPTSHKKKLRS